MERTRPTPTLEQMHVRGQYERRRTDTANLAAELSTPRNTERLMMDFDNGATQLRDVGGMITAQRAAILEAYQSNTMHNIVTTCPELLTTPIENLHRRTVSGTQDQPVGHNFFANAAGFIEAELPWAKQFDELLRNRTGASINDISRSNDSKGKDRLLAAITENPDIETMKSLSIYLAGRSLEGEKYLKQHYSEALERAKSSVYTTSQSIGATTGLRADMLERVAGQLQRATFGSFDHLEGMVTTDNSGAAGDYQIGSLRVEVQLTGDVRSAGLRSASEAYGTIVHELHHAGSAQTQEGYRCGLQVNGEGLEANEGMTEYLAQLSTGSPGIEQLPDGSSRIRHGVAYRAPVFAMFALHEQFKAGKNNHFATLFNAYHGDVRSQVRLEQSLDTFYQYDIMISDQLNSSAL